jgi:uncharacterized protein (DUF433 family)
MEIYEENHLERYIVERHSEGATIEEIASEVGLDEEMIEDIMGYEYTE